MFIANAMYVKLCFIFLCTTLLVTASCFSCWVDTITKRHVLDYDHYDQHNAGIIRFFGVTTAITSAAHLFYMGYKIYRNENLFCKETMLLSCCTCFSAFLTSYYGIKYFFESGNGNGVDSYCPRLLIREKNYNLITALLLHNKATAKKDFAWQQVSLRGLIQLESIASQEYEKRVTKIQKKFVLASLLLQPQKFETVASLKTNERIYKLRRQCKESWLKEQIRTFLYPQLPQRSLTLQKKIITALLLKILRTRFQQNPTKENLGALQKLPVEIFEHIVQYITANDKLPISNEEFFVHILPYVNARVKQNYLVTGSNYENDIRLPHDVWQLIDTFYDSNCLLYDGNYHVETHKLCLTKRNLLLTRRRQIEENLSKKKYLKKIAKTLNLSKKNISVQRLSNDVINSPFKITGLDKPPYNVVEMYH